MANDMSIRFLSRSTVQPRNNHPSDDNITFTPRIELTPSDLQHLFYEYTQRGLLFKKPTHGTNLVDTLKASLSLALHIFYPLAGRLVAVETYGTTSFHVECNHAGALFIHAATDLLETSDILEDTFGKLFPMSGFRNYEAAVDELPLLAVQATELGDGGFFIAFAINHAVADGVSFWRFINTFSEISRGGTFLSPGPVFSREYLDGVVDLPVRIPLSLEKMRDIVFLSLEGLQAKIIHFSKGKIADLKAKANSGDGGEDTVSSLQALMAHLWVCETRTRDIDPEEEVSHKVVVDLRPRLQPSLPPESFGNVISTVVVNCTAGELLEYGTGWAARRIKRAIAAQTPAEVRKFFEDWEAVIRQILGRITMSTSSSASSVPLYTIGSPRFDVYGNDFGWGKPVGVRKFPIIRFPGMVMVSPGLEEGSVDFDVCLSAKTLNGLANDPEFSGVFS